MTEEQTRTGQCMCGAVKFTLQTANAFGACHCKMCQRWASGMFMGVRANKIDFTSGKDNISLFKSSEWAERGFCKTCGSNLFYRMEASNGECFTSFGLGTLDDHDGLTFKRQLFVDSQTAEFTFQNDTEKFTKAQLEEIYGPT